MKFLKALFGARAEKHEDKADELRLDFEYRDSAYYYHQALESLDEDPEAKRRIQLKLREVRRQAYAQLLEEATELAQDESFDLAREKLETAANFADEETSLDEVNRRLHELSELLSRRAGPEAEQVEEVATDDAELFDLALSAFDKEDRDRAVDLGESYRLVYEMCQREEWAEARDQLDTLLETHPQEPLLLELAGMAAEQLQDHSAAVGYLEQVQRSASFRAPTVQALAALYRRLDRPADAQNLLSEAAAFRPVGPDLPEPWIEIHVEHALSLSEGGHYEEAVTGLLTLIEIRKTNRGPLFYNLAGVLEKAGQLEECRVAMEKAIEASPRSALYRERLADFLVSQKIELDLALHLLVEANQVETTGGGAMLGGGASKAVKSPNRARYLYKMARIFFFKGEDLEADRTITTALAISKDAEVTQALETLREELKEVRHSS